MRKDCATRKDWLLVVAAVTSLGLLVIQSAAAQEHHAADVLAVADERIHPSEVTLENVEAFQEQVRRDLPVGTAKKDVEEYLINWGIRHLYLEPVPIYGRYGNSFQCAIGYIGVRRGFDARLTFYIHLDGIDAVREISFSVKYL